ncbi:hypothetical protein [Spiroplasma taiwanense]|uniref:Uncharacterized protein n=1 Tax=Spiroplasma taiwanense CT-1 TaxID=1276220 RepID=S5LU37_9MOLU|nr:hypothetical protein [Spiroplasma taiwanense]AGR41249.1 hypothetical protein STAIW_v1c06300 [Spiroplasma taiwanense CT-1]
MFEKYNNMKKPDLENNLKEKEIEYKNIFKKEKEVNKKLKKNLFWWYFIPGFGLLIYQIHLNKRKTNDKNYHNLAKVKENLIYLELEIQIIKKKIDNI